MLPPSSGKPRQRGGVPDSYRRNANEYLTLWSQELAGIANDSVRLQSAQRRSEVIAKFREVERAAAVTSAGRMHP